MIRTGASTLSLCGAFLWTQKTDKILDFLQNRHRQVIGLFRASAQHGFNIRRVVHQAAHLGNGRSKPAKRPLSGNNGLVELDLSDRGGRDLFACFEDWVIQYGMPHHVIICQGHHKASLAKFAAARGVKIV